MRYIDKFKIHPKPPFYIDNIDNVMRYIDKFKIHPKPPFYI